MRYLLGSILALVLMFVAIPAEAGSQGSNFVVLSNGQIVVLPTNNDYFGNSFHFSSVNTGFHNNNVQILDFRRRPRPRPVVTVFPNGTTVVRPR